MLQRAELQNINTTEPSQIQAEQRKFALDKSACMTANMLSGLTQEGEIIHHKAESTPKGTVLGDGLQPIPAKLTERICQWEYIDMSDLPEFWPDQKAEEGTAKRANWSTAKKRDRT